MMLGQPVRILGAALLLAGLLVGLVVLEARARAAGTEVVLPMEAVDPRNLLTGHYAALRLAHALPPDAECPSGTRAPHRWVALAPTEAGHRVSGAAEDREAARKLGPVVVLGRADCLRRPARPGEAPAPSMVELDLGIHRFHADQSEAEALERALMRRGADEPAQAFAVVSVGEDGRARLKGVIVNGQRTELSWF